MDIRTDVLYLQKGAKIEYTGGSTKMNLSYIAIQPTFTYKFANWDCKINPGHAASAFVGIGPDISLLASSKQDPAPASGSKVQGAKSSDIGLNIGVGVNIPVGNGHLSPELRYNLGLTKAVENTSHGTTSSSKNNGIQIMFGYMF